MLFTPETTTLTQVQPTVPIGDLVEEVSVYAASPQFVQDHCGPIANAILDAVPYNYFARCARLGLQPNIDFRVHRLNVGEFPAVPGWHCDGIYRETYHGQPNPDRIRIRDTVLCSVSTGDVCNPQMATESLRIPTSPSDDPGFWKYVHDHVPDSMGRRTLPDGEMLQIGAKTLHRVMPACVRGVRALFRMSMWHNDYLGEGGKIARQQQVYLLDEGAGW